MRLLHESLRHHPVVDADPRGTDIGARPRDIRGEAGTPGHPGQVGEALVGPVTELARRPLHVADAANQAPEAVVAAPQADDDALNVMGPAVAEVRERWPAGHTGRREAEVEEPRKVLGAEGVRVLVAAPPQPGPEQFGCRGHLDVEQKRHATVEMLHRLVDREQLGVGIAHLREVEVGDEATVGEGDVVAHHQAPVGSAADIEFKAVDRERERIVEVTSRRRAPLALDGQTGVADDLHGGVAAAAWRRRVPGQDGCPVVGGEPDHASQP